MWYRGVILASILGLSCGQLVDDFSCPDEFEGFYPHLISCDKYWHCQNSVATLKTCGNGLAFLDTDETFTLEQCEELHLVDCGPRTEIEPPISTANCPRLYGTFADPESCSVFWKCLDGRSNRYECPPGLAYDQVSRGCKWADQVPDCKNVVVAVEGEEELFKCPAHSAIGTFTKHAHPADCRQYFVCIGGVPREYGCPEGTVFSIGGDEFSGKCANPDEVDECRNYYGDLEFDVNDLNRAGADTGPVGPEERSRSGGIGAHSFRNSANRIPTGSADPEKRVLNNEAKRRPAPPALQAIVDNEIDNDNRDVFEPVVEEAAPVRQRPRPLRPRPVATTTTQFTRPPTTTTTAFTNPPTTNTVLFAAPTTTTTSPPAPIEVITERFEFPEVTATERQPEPITARPTFSRRPPPPSLLNPANSAAASGGVFPATNRPFTVFNSQPDSPPVVAAPVSSSSPTFPPRFVEPAAPAAASPFLPAAAAAPPAGSVVLASDGLPDPKPAKAGPNGEEYYYYYYYYDEDEGGAPLDEE